MDDHGLDPVDHLDGQLAIRREHPRQGPIDDPLWVDGVGQHTPKLTRLGQRTIGPTDSSCQGVMDIEADLAIGKDAAADAVHLVADDPIGRSGDGAVPLQSRSPRADGGRGT